MKALVSIHDVMPETMTRVEALLSWLQDRKVPPVALLVVPGKPWTEATIQRLADFSAQGHELVAHGWTHQTTPRKLYHRLHSQLISRNVAEHLALNASGVFDLMQRSAQWFPRNGLPQPVTYIPPSWALGSIGREALSRLPYRIVENTRGVIHTQRAECTGLPLIGFEADNARRKSFLRIWNHWQVCRATRSGKPLRISIHPDDLQLRLADQMDTIIGLPTEFLSYRNL
ncbi:MAG: DUF2334 domain-containing protein [Puniceicoccaceae bacterium MED-G30]|nr:MAG: DUF2334 domain-containing protein [Puniceicoccaceae bacterium MED-G30]